MLRLVDLGWSDHFQQQFVGTIDLLPVRVCGDGREVYRVIGEAAREWLASICGKLRHEGRFPAVGDWVLVNPPDAAGKVVIQRCLRRRSAFVRKVAGRVVAEQVLAANVDTVFVVTSFTREFNARRLERYLTLTWESNARPVIVINKADLCADTPDEWVMEAGTIAPGVPVHVVSAATGAGFEALSAYTPAGQTIALLGSSGVGKSTMINRLLGGEQQRVQPVREDDDRGRHTTTSRQLFILPGGGVVIDTPGIRELQLWDSGEGLRRTFTDIDSLAAECRFADCGHGSEPGCAVLAAVEAGQLDPARLESYHKLVREQRYLELKVDGGLRAEQRRQWRVIHKAMRKMPKKF